MGMESMLRWVGFAELVDQASGRLTIRDPYQDAGATLCNTDDRRQEGQDVGARNMLQNVKQRHQVELLIRGGRLRSYAARCCRCRQELPERKCRCARSRRWSGPHALVAKG